MIEELEIEIYRYGFEILISTILGLLITITIGILLRMFFLSVLYYVIFVSVRQLTGGYHATSYLKCNLLFSAVTLYTLGMVKISYMNDLYTITKHGLILVVVMLSVWKYAPVENPNKPLTESHMIRNHKISLILIAVLGVLSCILYVNTDKNYAIIYQDMIY